MACGKPHGVVSEDRRIDPDRASDCRDPDRHVLNEFRCGFVAHPILVGRQGHEPDIHFVQSLDFDVRAPGFEAQVDSLQVDRAERIGGVRDDQQRECMFSG